MSDSTSIHMKEKKIMRGVVVSDAMDKTIVVSVDTFKTDTMNHKKYKSSKKYKVHDESNAYKSGETVEFVQTRPRSKGKSLEALPKK